MSAASTPNPSLIEALRGPGYVLASAAQLADTCAVPLASLKAWEPSWEALPRDTYLRDGGDYRSRRHSCFIQDLEHGTLTQTPQRAHWQPTDYNALHGGMERWFEPIAPELTSDPAWAALVSGLGRLFASLKPVSHWYVEAHQFRIDTAQGIGRPTPEGAHRDGVDFVAVVLVQRHDIIGGETRVFDAHGTDGWRFTISEPWSALLLDDAHVIHESTPIQPGSVEEGAPTGVRDTLVLTFRAGGFQAPT